MEKTWDGRFKKTLDPAADKFNASIAFDKRLFKYDVAAGIAHTKALHKAGIITLKETNKIIGGLKDLLKKEGSINFSAYEDVHSAVETELSKAIGETGKKLHTGRSRNDLVATDTRMYMMVEIKNIMTLIKKLMARMTILAEKNINVFMPGFTHLQHAQVISAGQWLMAYCSMLKRDHELFEFVLKRTDRLTIGSGALAGSNYNIDRALLAKETGFKNVAENSMDAVSDRDFVLDFLYASSVSAVHLSRLAEEIIIYNSSEFNFLEIDDTFATGSSIMPHKKNPDIAELIRGKAGKFFGGLMAGFTMLKGLPLAYNKDMQEDKVLVFSRLDELKDILNIAEKLLANISFKTEKLDEQLNDYFMYAVDVADYLVKKGTAFRDSHKIVGQMVSYAIDNNKSFPKFEEHELNKFSNKFGEDYYAIFDPMKSVNSKRTSGSTSIASVKKQIAAVKKFTKK
ncbi:MAG: argininosuccinate lyase [bacterium]